jgi:hypothetical protein
MPITRNNQQRFKHRQRRNKKRKLSNKPKLPSKLVESRWNSFESIYRFIPTVPYLKFKLLQRVTRLFT